MPLCLPIDLIAAIRSLSFQELEVNLVDQETEEADGDAGARPM